MSSPPLHLGSSRRLSHHYVSPFMDELVSPYLLTASYAENQVDEEDDDEARGLTSLLDFVAEPSRVGRRSPEPQSDPQPWVEEGPSLLTKPIYDPTGEWQWLSGLSIRDSTSTTSNHLVSEGKDFRVTLASGKAGLRTIHYMAKFCTHWGPDTWDGFFFEIALFKLDLLPLQVAPTLLGVYCDVGRKILAMAPPHHSFWMHASPEMPHSLKELCMDAVRILHLHGILHGDLRPSNVLIGGNANVTIINYQNARLSYPITQPNLQRETATPAEFAQELRKFSWTLDYRGARAKEDRKLTELVELIKEPTSNQLALQQEAQFLLSLDPSDVSPKRFITPGQPPEDLAREINTFIDQLDEFKDRERRLITFEPSTPTPRVPNSPSSTAATVHSSEGSSTPPSKPARANSTRSFGLTSADDHRKRKRSVEATLYQPDKRTRFSDSVASDSDSESGSICSSDLDAISYFEMGETSRNAKEAIIETNIRRCAKLGLPHPEAVSRDPDNPRWKDPNVLEYMDRHNRNVIYKTYIMERNHKPKTFKIPQPKRSLGNIKRAMHAITHPRRMERDAKGATHEGGRKKRKRAVEDDGCDLIQMGHGSKRSSKASKTFERFLHDSSSSSTKSFPRMPPRGILKNPSSVMPRIFAKSVTPSRFYYTSRFSFPFKFPRPSTRSTETGNASHCPSIRTSEARFSAPTLGYQPTAYIDVVAQWIGGILGFNW